MERRVALVVDDDSTVRALAVDILTEAGIRPTGSATWTEARSMLERRTFDVVLLDAGIAEGRVLAEAIRDSMRLSPESVSIVLGPTMADALAATVIDAGAFDVVPKPFSGQTLRLAVERAVRQASILEDLDRYRSEIRGREGYDRLVGRSEPMERLRDRVEQLADTNHAVLLVGEEGTGRKLTARTIHRLSSRADAPFVVVGCSTLSPERLAIALFGRGDVGDDPLSSGAIGSARGGVLFLDEVAALPPELQDRIVESLGSERASSLDVRVMSSTARDIRVAVEDGLIRGDLYRLLSEAIVEIEPLRMHPEDIAVLARHFLQTICEINAEDPIHLTAETVSILEAYRWPGNVRELRNAMEQAVILSIEGSIHPDALPERVREYALLAPGTVPGFESGLTFRASKRQVVDAFERSYLHDVLTRTEGNVTAAAQESGMLRSALQRLLRKHGIRSALFRSRVAPAP